MSDSDDEYRSSDNELVEPLLRENKRLRWTLAKYQKKNSILKDVLIEKDIKISELEKRHEERDELIAKQEDTIRNLIRQMNEQTSELNFMTAKLKDTSAESGNDAIPTRDTEVTSLKATIDIQSRRNNELSDELQEERKKREKLETNIDMWRFNIGECEREIEQLKEQREKLRFLYRITIFYNSVESGRGTTAKGLCLMKDEVSSSLPHLESENHSILGEIRTNTLTTELQGLTFQDSIFQNPVLVPSIPLYND